MAHKSRSGNRCFQFLCSRLLKFDSINDIPRCNLPPVLECRLRPEDVGFPQLGEGEPFGLADGYFKLFPGDNWAQPHVVLAAQARVRVSELNYAIKPSRSLHGRRLTLPAMSLRE